MMRTENRWRESPVEQNRASKAHSIRPRLLTHRSNDA